MNRESHDDALIPAMIRLANDASEIAALIAANITAAAEREGRVIARSDLAEGIGPLLAGAWSLAKLAADDVGSARAAYAELLRKHLAAVEGPDR